MAPVEVAHEAEGRLVDELPAEVHPEAEVDLEIVVEVGAEMDHSQVAGADREAALVPEEVASEEEDESIRVS